MNSVMVTGGNGYIGSHMAKFLFNKGHNVIIVDNHCTSPQNQTHQFGKFYNYDIADKDQIKKIILEHKIECVFHFAARALVGESEEKPIFYYQENFSKTLELLSACIETKMRKFIFSSTCATFGVPTTDYINENNQQQPINSYGWSKLLMETSMRDLASKNLLDFVVFRYFNAAGCSPQTDIGENHEPETHLIPNIVKAYLSGGRQKFKINGTDYPTPDGTCVRDYIHVDDLAQAHFDGYQYLKNKSGFYDFNLGSGNGSSIKDVIAAFEKVTKKKLEVEICPRRPGDPPRLVSDSKKAKKELNFSPQYSLEDSILHTLKYFKRIYGL